MTNNDDLNVPSIDDMKASLDFLNVQIKKQEIGSTAYNALFAAIVCVEVQIEQETE